MNIKSPREKHFFTSHSQTLCILYTVTVSVSVQQYILYYPSTPSLHVSVLLGHLQVMITVLDCHTVRFVYINIYILF
jgi:hypothetical protein